MSAPPNIFTKRYRKLTKTTIEAITTILKTYTIEPLEYSIFESRVAEIYNVEIKLGNYVPYNVISDLVNLMQADFVNMEADAEKDIFIYFEYREYQKRKQ